MFCCMRWLWSPSTLCTGGGRCGPVSGGVAMLGGEIGACRSGGRGWDCGCGSGFLLFSPDTTPISDLSKRVPLGWLLLWWCLWRGVWVCTPAAATQIACVDKGTAAAGRGLLCGWLLLSWGPCVASASAAKWTCFGVLTVAALSVAFVVGCSELCVSVCRALCCSGCFGLAFWFVGGVAVVSPILVSRATEGDSRLTVSFHFWGP